jgi:hypothetical protein
MDDNKEIIINLCNTLNFPEEFIYLTLTNYLEILNENNNVNCDYFRDIYCYLDFINTNINHEINKMKLCLLYSTFIYYKCRKNYTLTTYLKSPDYLYNINYIFLDLLHKNYEFINPEYFKTYLYDILNIVINTEYYDLYKQVFLHILFNITIFFDNYILHLELFNELKFLDFFTTKMNFISSAHLEKIGLVLNFTQENLPEISFLINSKYYVVADFNLTFDKYIELIIDNINSDNIYYNNLLMFYSVIKQ